MDNEYTRKEKVCPLISDYCDCEHMNCTCCITYEEDYIDTADKEGMIRLNQLIKRNNL